MCLSHPEIAQPLLEEEPPKRSGIGSVVLGRSCKVRRTVPSGMQAKRTLTGTNLMHTESHLEQESEYCVSSQTSYRTVTQQNGIAAILPTTTELTELPWCRSTATDMPVLVVNHVKHRTIHQTCLTDRTVVSAGSVCQGAASGNYIGTEMGSVHPSPTQIVVDRAE